MRDTSHANEPRDLIHMSGMAYSYMCRGPLVFVICPMRMCVRSYTETKTSTETAAEIGTKIETETETETKTETLQQ